MQLPTLRRERTPLFILRRSRPLTLLVAAILIGLTAACGSTGGSGEAKTIRVGLSSKSPTMLPLYVALDKGYFSAAGVKVAEPVVLPSGAKLAAAVVGGSIDVGIGVTPDVFNLAGTGKPVKIIGETYPSYYVDIVKGKGIKAPDNADLKTKIKALAGKKIGITGPGSGTEALLTYLFRQAGLDPAKDAEVVSLGSDPSAAITALKSGQVDAVSHILSVGQQAEAEGIGQIYISPGHGDVPALKGTLHGVAYALQPTIDAKRPDTKAFLKAMQRGLDFIHEHPEDAVRILQKRFSGMSPKVLSTVGATVVANVPKTLAIDPHGYEVEADMLKQAGILQKEAPPLDKLAVSDLTPKAP